MAQFCSGRAMLMKAPEKASLLLCSTCRFSRAERVDPNGASGGQLFAGQVAAALTEHSCRDRLALQTMPCLFACSSHCTAYVRAEGRMGYVLGGFAPSASDAVALLDYIGLYLDSAEGVVPYAQWPQGVKGHFLVRIPPDGFVWDEAGAFKSQDEEIE